MPSYTKAGTIPIRMKGRQIEICFVTSRSRRAVYVLPKGTIGKKEKARQTASRETFEEAGVEGRMLHPLKNGKKQKSIKIKTREYNAKYFILLVDIIHKSWPEKSMRDRKWMNAMALRRKHTIKRDRDLVRSMLKMKLKEAIFAAKATSSAA